MSFDPTAIRAAVEKDFQNRGLAQNISLGMMRVVRFLSTFQFNDRGRLADPNQKFTQPERRLVFIENQHMSVHFLFLGKRSSVKVPERDPHLSCS
jgi:uncharacterized protein